MTSSQLVSARDLAELVDIPLAQIWRLTREDKIPAYQFGQQYRYDPGEVLSSTRREPASPADRREKAVLGIPERRVMEP